jgi:ABC-type lipoprotein release transport system permease subunit
LVVAEGFRFTLAGIVIGGTIALLAGRWIAPLLFNQSPRDPTVFATVIFLLLAVAVTASTLPALRGARVHPNTLLRTENG